MCRSAAAPSEANEEDDAFDVDLYDVDDVANSEEGWCAEGWFAQHIKPKFSALIGWNRTDVEFAELRSSKAYDDVYAALFCFALNVTCRCCTRRELRSA